MKKHKRKSPLVVILLLILLAGMGFLGYHLLNIKTIEVSGCEKKTPEYVVRLSGLAIGTNILKIDDAHIRESIEKDPYLKFIKIERIFPDKAVIVIGERKPAALMKAQGTHLLLDSEGYVLEMKDDVSGLKYPVVDGIDISSCAIGKQIGFVDKAQQLAMQTLVNEIYAKDADSFIAEIDLININDIRLKSVSGIKISFGNYGMLEKKILWIKKVLEKLQAEGKSGGTLDVSSGDSATYREGGD